MVQCIDCAVEGTGVESVVGLGLQTCLQGLAEAGSQHHPAQGGHPAGIGVHQGHEQARALAAGQAERGSVAWGGILVEVVRSVGPVIEGWETVQDDESDRAFQKQGEFQFDG